MPETENVTREVERRSPVWVKVLLGISLALNLMVAGIVAGAVIKGPPQRADAGREMGGAPFFRALEPEDRRAVFRDFRERSDGIRQGREAMRVQFETLLAALRAEEFDAEAVAELLEEQRGAAVGRQEMGEEVLIARLSQMDVAARRAFADRLEEGLRRDKR